MYYINKNVFVRHAEKLIHSFDIDINCDCLIQQGKVWGILQLLFLRSLEHALTHINNSSLCGKINTYFINLFILWLGRENAEDLIRGRFAHYHLEIDAFSSMRYIGVQTVSPPSSFTKLRAAITAELNNTAVRSPRSPQLVFTTLKVSYYCFFTFSHLL